MHVMQRAPSRYAGGRSRRKFDDIATRLPNSCRRIPIWKFILSRNFLGWKMPMLTTTVGGTSSSYLLSGQEGMLLLQMT
jgi:hypothetical protein